LLGWAELYESRAGVGQREAAVPEGAGDSAGKSAGLEQFGLRDAAAGGHVDVAFAMGAGRPGRIFPITRNTRRYAGLGFYHQQVLHVRE